MSSTCLWHEDGNSCEKPSLKGKSYCDLHYKRVYLDVPSEMADFIIEKEIKEILKDSF